MMVGSHKMVQDAIFWTYSEHRWLRKLRFHKEKTKAAPEAKRKRHLKHTKSAAATGLTQSQGLDVGVSRQPRVFVSANESSDSVPLYIGSPGDP